MNTSQFLIYSIIKLLNRMHATLHVFDLNPSDRKWIEQRCTSFLASIKILVEKPANKKSVMNEYQGYHDNLGRYMDIVARSERLTLDNELVDAFQCLRTIHKALRLCYTIQATMLPNELQTSDIYTYFIELQDMALYITDRRGYIPYTEDKRITDKLETITNVLEKISEDINQNNKVL